MRSSAGADQRRHLRVAAGRSFLPYVLGADDAGGRRDQLRTALARYTAAIICHHRQDQVIPDPNGGR